MTVPLLKSIASLQDMLQTAECLGITEPPSLSHLMRKMSKITGAYPTPLFPVEACFDAYISTVQEHLEKKSSTEVAIRAGQLAYCTRLPRLADAESVRDFIACIVHGMAIGAIPSVEGTRLLYGAQIANSTLPTPKRNKKRHKSTKNAPGNQPITPTPSMT